jgi:hypothetical protein
MASLGAARAQNGAPAAGAGADQEAVSALAPHDRGLIGTFHVGGPFEKALDYNLLDDFLSSSFSARPVDEENGRVVDNSARVR